MPINNIGIQFLNMGIQMINIGMNMPNNQNDMFNFNQNIQNIINQLENIGMSNQQMGVPMGMNMPPIKMDNSMFDSDFMSRFNDEIIEPQMTMDRFDDGIMEPEDKKLNIIFEDSTGKKNIVVVDYGTTVDNLLKKYLNILDMPQNKVVCIYNMKRLNLGDETKVEDKFGTNSKIVVVIN